MTAKDVQLLDEKIDVLTGTVIEFMATFKEKFKHVPTKKDIEKEVTKQIKLARADCPGRKANPKKAIPIKDLIYLGIILGGAIAGYLQ
jgi:hypothetical protein